MRAHTWRNLPQSDWALQISQGTTREPLMAGRWLLLLNTLKKFRSLFPAILSHFVFLLFILLLVSHFSSCAFSFIYMNSKLHTYSFFFVPRRRCSTFSSNTSFVLSRFSWCREYGEFIVSLVRTFLAFSFHVFFVVRRCSLTV